MFGYSFITVLLISLFFTNSSEAKLSLVEGSYANRSHIDHVRRTANLNFIYEGCDPNPSAAKINLNSDGLCKSIKEYELKTSQGQIINMGKLGEVFVDYNEPDAQCDKTFRSQVSSNFSLVDIYKKFAEKNCRPTHLVIRGSREKMKPRLWKAQRNRSLCKLPMAHISKEGFPTELHEAVNMTANDQGFKIGKHTHYRFDHDQKLWCMKFTDPVKGDQPDVCRHWPSPLPVAFSDKAGQGPYHMKATISLSPDGKASVRAINKTYPDTNAMFEDQKNGGFTKNDKAKGRIDFKTWRNNKSGLIRSVVKAYETDDKNGNHQRTLNFFARNVFGLGITNSWCNKEHCFNKSRSERMTPHSCGENPKVEMTYGGNGNTCHSCIGVMPGHCAIKPPEVKVVQSALKQDKSFSILDSGEYKLGQNIEAGLIKNFNTIVTNPRNPGCHKGYAPSFDEIYEPEESVPTRSEASVKQSL